MDNRLVGNAKQIDPRAGCPPSAAQLVDTAKLIDAHYARRPDPATPAQRVAFGTSGYRGSSFDSTFNEAHVLAITQATGAIASRSASQVHCSSSSRPAPPSH